MRGMEACKSEQEGQRREKEEQLYAEMEGLKAQLQAFQSRNSVLEGEAPSPLSCRNTRSLSAGACMPAQRAQASEHLRSFCLVMHQGCAAHLSPVWTSPIVCSRVLIGLGLSVHLSSACGMKACVVTLESA